MSPHNNEPGHEADDTAPSGMLATLRRVRTFTRTKNFISLMRQTRITLTAAFKRVNSAMVIGPCAVSSTKALQGADALEIRPEEISNFMESQQNERSSTSYPEVSWDDLATPGFYVSRATGNGYRVPAEALIKGASPVIEQVSAQPSRLVKLSDNPFIPLIKARNLAANCNIEPNF